MAQCQRCGDDTVYGSSGKPKALCDDCFEFESVGEHGAARVAHARTTAYLPKDELEGSKQNLTKANSRLRDTVTDAHNEIVRTGEPMGPSLARSIVELGLLRAMLSTKAATVLSASAKLAQLYGLHRKPVAEEEPESLTEEEEGDANAKAQDLASRYGIDVN